MDSALQENKKTTHMKIIIPMAGRGSRLRPHTLTVPKPLIPIAGKPIVQRLVQDIAKVAGDDVDAVLAKPGSAGLTVLLTSHFQLDGGRLENPKADLHTAVQAMTIFLDQNHENFET